MSSVIYTNDQSATTINKTRIDPSVQTPQYKHFLKAPGASPSSYWNDILKTYFELQISCCWIIDGIDEGSGFIFTFGYMLQFSFMLIPHEQ